MPDSALLVRDLAAAFALALAGGWIATRLRLPSLAGYVVAGVVISPFTPGYAGDVNLLLQLADVGIVLLLFGIGVQFSLSDLLEAGPSVIVMALLQVAAIIFMAVGIGEVAGWSRNESLYLGGAAAISSSAVLVKMLEWRGDVRARFGRLAITWSLVQDISSVLLIVLFAALTGGHSTSSAAIDAVVALAKAVGFIVAVVVLGARVVPAVLARVAEERSRELFVLAIAVLAIFTAWFSDFAGLSLALGAFLAGVVVSESDLSYRVLGDMLPLRDIFAVLFFTSVGMLIDPGVLLDEWQTLLWLTLLIIIVKPFIAWAGLRLRERMDVAVLAGASLASASEFSFVLGRSGLDHGGLGPDAFTALLGATSLSIIVAPLLTRAAVGFRERVLLAGAPIPAREPARPMRLGRHAVICGYGSAGRLVARVLAPRFDVLVVEDDRVLAAQARSDGMDVIEENPAQQGAIDRMRLSEARQLIVTLGDAFATRLITERARAINPYIDISGVAISGGEAEKLHRSGISTAVVAEDEAALELARHALHRFGVSSPEALAIVQRQRERRG